ncbi:erythrocyte membrane protein 1, PfEMP1, putative [Plasmodium reichenowi]|uniref:Erythrocyte membrane protein 1, PfEMP1, putative n=1 Tax=Plasmodium reichenowi TaxID=5854 RepID=A0A2P9D9P0_PLARE|nr:erythrocyte membrane protein 1, PfEMP1, putative [Plasmodium reichenowi]
MAPGNGGADRTARDILEEIGEKIQKEATKTANNYRKELQGHLSNVVFSNGGTVTNKNPCLFDHTKDTNVTVGQGREHPCLNRSNVRFSDEKGAECYRTRINGNEKYSGACAPYRRLHLCDKNLEQIRPEQITNTHNLLVDVLLAAKHEGQSIINNYRQLDNNTKIGVCTALARSFADIGDIIRGKDLFLGHQQKKKKLEASLKGMFENIKDNKNSTLKNLSLEHVREYWWALNRDQVWKAITCDAEEKDIYSKNPENGMLRWYDKCRHRDGNIPTNLDYVPQYLRWFHEWTEDFCRKRKVKLENAIGKCRGEDKKKYCTLNGYDCTQTIRGKNHLVRDSDCNKCSSSCIPFVDWIDIEKREFEKQKRKYDKEIKKIHDTTKDTKYGKVNSMYAKEFYDELKIEHEDVKTFLQLLNKENICKSEPNVGQNKANSVDFTQDPDKTFSHTEYCDPCPWCGVHKEGSKWKAKHVNSCGKKEKKIYDPKKTTDITILSPDRRKRNMLQKYNKFCFNTENKDKQMENWKCYYDKNDKSDYCVLQNENIDTQDEKIMSYYSFFSLWIKRMLDDSIDWREQLSNCMNYAKLKQCTKWCKNKCECYEKWVIQKNNEWTRMKKHFQKQDLPKGGHFKTLEWFLEDEFFHKIKEAYGNEEEIERIKKLLHNKDTTENDNVVNQEDIVEKLLEHEMFEAVKCKQTHNEQNCENTAGGRIKTPRDLSLDEEDESESDDDEGPQQKDSRTNPCATPSGGDTTTQYPVLAKKVAKEIQMAAHKEMLGRSVDKSGKGDSGDKVSLLKADAKQGTYTRGGIGSELTDACSITDKHTNDGRGTNYGPCANKGNGLDIGIPWDGGKTKSNISDVYIRPRRKHMCTSNLEHLHHTKYGRFKQVQEGKCNHSFLGDVLLSAKYEAKKIMELYDKNKVKSGQNDKNGLTDDKTVCRAMKNSFADIGDIIRGRDLWDDKDQVTLQDHLKTIFGKIKGELKGEDKYKDDDKRTPKYKQLREDWWEANRDQVWKAMQCAYQEGDCDSSVPYDDYIPQRLRWMTEWAEWFCKAQKKEYETLKGACGNCKDKIKGDDQCTEGTPNCQKCKEACTEYKTKIQPWANQWTQMQVQYYTLYSNADKYAVTSFGKNYPDYQQVAHFFKELKQKYDKTATSSSTTMSPYDTAAGYIHQEAHITECDVQNEFCEKENGVARNTDGAKENKKYAFKDPPKDYEGACGCGKNTKAAKKEEKKNACTIVGEIITEGNNDGNTAIGGCEPKTKGSYPEWKCGDQSLVKDQNVCIPPRRIKLCLYYLKELKEHTPDGLRKEFIKNVAAETFVSWHYYKSKNNDAEQKLQSGEIPPVFLRSMYYTYADYRDIFFGIDIFSRTAPGDTTAAKDNIKSVFSNDSKSPSGKDPRETWWEENAESIWKGMVCALEKASGDKKGALTTKYPYNNIKFSDNTTLEEFAQTPQFLRWFTEWGDDFCREHVVQIEELKKGCKDYNCGDNEQDKKERCKNACQEYQKWLKEWKEKYNKQSEKYFKHKKTYKDNPSVKVEVNASTYAYEYLNKALQKLCGNGDCKCMEQESEQHKDASGTSETYNSRMPASLDDTPSDYKDKCKCPERQEEKKSKSPPPKEDTSLNVCETVKTALEDTDKMREACKTKYDGKYYGWKCIPTKTSNDVATSEGDSANGVFSRRTRDTHGKATSTDSGSICVPPRRRKLYIGKIKEWTDKVSGSDSSVSGSTGQVLAGNSQEARASSSSSEASSQTSDKLRNAFIESAAVETFFLWHQYKQMNTKKTQGDGLSLGLGVAEGLTLSIEGNDATLTRRSGAAVGGMPGSGAYPHGQAPSSLGKGPHVSPGLLPGAPSSFIPPGQDESSSWARGQPGFISGSTDRKISPPGELDDRLNNRASSGPQLPGTSGALPSLHSSVDPNDPASLKNGVIPPSFLRQMFYTLGDYRDICVGGDHDIVGDTIVRTKDSNSGDTKTETKISEIIKQFLQNSDSKPGSAGSHSGSTLTLSRGTPNPSGDKPSEWWEKNVQHIWHGMICALTYEDNGGKTPTKINGADKLWDNTKNKPTNDKYEYKNVELKDENSDTQAYTTGSSLSGDDPINNPKLTQFVVRPPFFRYLEEWGETFCKKRTNMLEKIKEECRGGENIIRYNDGDGFDCTQMVPDQAKIFGDFNGFSCANSCSFYKKWIKKKRTEYEKQKEIYKEQKKDAEGNKDAKSIKDGNGFYTKLGECPEAKDFLQKLGSCKNNENDNGVGKTYFDESKAFQHATDCDPCPEFGVEYKNGQFDNVTENTCMKKTFKTTQGVKNKEDSIEIYMFVSDDSKSGNGFEGNDLKEACEHAGIFTGIKKDVWKCGYKCGYEVCKSQKGNDTINGKQNEKQNLHIRTLFKSWAENFLEDYKKIKHKISHCINNGNESICTSDCGKKCECVSKWIEKKQQEWPTIRDRYLEPYKSDDGYDTKSLVTDFMGTLIPQIALTNGKKNLKTLDEFLKAYACKCYGSSKKENSNEDVIQCMLEDLGTKMTSCLASTSGSEQPCGENSTPVEDDDDEPFEEEENPENKVGKPSFCPEQVDDKKKVVEEEGCGDKDEEKDKGDEEEPSSHPPSTPGGDSTPEQTPVLKPEQEAPPAPENTDTKSPTTNQPLQPPSNPKPPPAPRKKREFTSSDWRDVMSASAFPWSVGVAFVALTYWFLKKKTKSPVDLFRVLEIPQNDYGMPTKLSRNRYIPYKTAQYRGKRYIYLEGDSGTDSGYTDHYSDITSSSESEYEEFDINDIYAPSAPKYKTLIEVVLEPSKKDIPSSDTPTNKFTDEEWNQLKHEFISNMLQNTQNTEPNSLYDNVDNNTHPTMSRHNVDQKPFIMSIHDRNLYTGEEYNYDMINNIGNNDSYSGSGLIGDNHGSYSGNHYPYSGIDLINDSLNSGNHDIYNELLKRKENELFGTNHVKHTSTHSVAKHTNSDPIMNQIDLFHKWLDRHKDMCEKWDKNNKVDILNKLKEEWNKDNNKHNGENTINKMLNTDVSIQIDMDNSKTMNEFTNMDTILEDLDKYNEPYYDVQDDIYYDVNDDKTSVDHINMDYNKMDNNNSDVPTKVQIEMNIINNKKEIFEEEYPISDIWNI